MPVRKDFIRQVYPFSGILPLRTLSRLSGQDFILPFYHVVSDEPCPHIRHLYSYKNSSEFERDIDYLASHYQPISAEQLPDVIAGKYIGQKIMLLSFDDGLRQVYDVAAPVLLRKGIPAVFFINTDFTDNRELMFRYKVSLALETDYDRYYGLLDKVGSNGDFNQETQGELDWMCRNFLDSYQPYMTNMQLQELLAKGFTLGAHSCSHPYYYQLPLEKQLFETIASMDILQERTGVKQRLFAFPFTDSGVSKRFFDYIYSNGRIDFSFGGAGIKKDIHQRQMQRIPMEGWSASAEQLLKAEYLYYLFRIPFGRNSIRRGG